MQALYRLIKTAAVPGQLLADVQQAMRTDKGALLTFWSQREPGGGISARYAVAAGDAKVFSPEYLVHPGLGYRVKQP